MALSTLGSSDAKDQKKALMKDIIRYCGRYNEDERETVLMMGKTGVGKSATINTVAKFVNGEYFQLAVPGAGTQTQSRTGYLVTYKNCGKRQDMDRRQTDDEEDAFVETVKEHLPHLIDFAGLPNADTPALREILELLIAGFIPPGVAIEALERDQQRFGIGSLRTKYDTANPQWRVTKIVFVHSCNDAIPTVLIECLLKCISSVNEGEDTIKYKGDVFLLITKYDLVDQQQRRAPAVSRTSDGGSQNVQEVMEISASTQESSTSISMADFELIEKTLAGLFSIKGALKHNRLRWTNYCEEIGYDNENIDVIVLEFIKQMVMPTLQRDFPVPPEIPLSKRWQLEFGLLVKETVQAINLSKRDVIVFVVAFVILLVAWYVMKTEVK